MEPNKTGVSEQVLHSEYRRIDSEYREKTSCCKWVFFSDQLPVSWAIDSLSMTLKRMLNMFPHWYWYLRYWKHRKKPCVLVLIAPHSPRQWWYPILLELLVDIPRKLHGRCWHKGMQYSTYQSRVSKSGKWKFQVWFQKEKVHLESPGLYQAGKEKLNRQRRYLTRLVIYRSWCDRRHNSPYSASVDDLAIFFCLFTWGKRL